MAAASITEGASTEQVHLQFGADAAKQMIVSWAAPVSVSNPRVRFGTPDGGLGGTVMAETRTYRDAVTGVEILTHALLEGLTPSTGYFCEALHDGGTSLPGAFTTGPGGRKSFRFTSFGDQGADTPTDIVSGPHGAYVVDQVEQQNPLFHLLNGDLCYANVNDDRSGVWQRFFTNNMRSARN